MPNKTWKSVERRVASMLGGERVKLSGINSGYSSGDVLDPNYLIEVKTKKQSSLHRLFSKVEKEAKAEQKTPLLVMHQKNTSKYLAVMDLEELIKWRKNL